MNIELAIREWRLLLGDEKVICQPERIEKYHLNTESIKRYIPAVLIPQNANEIIKIINIANRYRVPVYPISTGKNWGYGAGNPVQDGCVIVDLSAMNRIIDFDNELGLVTLEPGVTQQQLYDYLIQHNYPYLVPITGAGPTCSILANALERGFGGTPYFDHFAAVTHLEAILANGEIYTTPLTSLGGEVIDKSFKWGIGPYLDGLFSQGNFGIVTKMTIALAPIPKASAIFIINLKSKDSLKEYVKLVREIMKTCSPNDVAINLMNAKRIVSMQAFQSLMNNPLADNKLIHHMNNLLQEGRVNAWTVVGTLQGKTSSIFHASKKSIKQIVRSSSGRVKFYDLRFVNRIKRLCSLIPLKSIQRIMQPVIFLERTLKMFAGIPGEVALPLAYLKSGTLPAHGINLNPARDGCGLIWYSPLVEMKPEKVEIFANMVDEICTRYHIEPLITLSALSNRCFNATIPILFNTQTEVANGHDCYKALFLSGQEKGCIPYRVGIQTMPYLTEMNTSYWHLVKQFKHAIDPYNILAPGRYAPQYKITAEVNKNEVEAI